MRSLKGQGVVVDIEGGRAGGGGLMSISGDITWVAQTVCLAKDKVKKD